MTQMKLYEAFFEACRTIANLNQMADAFESVGLLLECNKNSEYWAALTSAVRSAMCILGLDMGDKNEEVYNRLAVLRPDTLEREVIYSWKTWKVFGYQ